MKARRRIAIPNRHHGLHLRKIGLVRTWRMVVIMIVEGIHSMIMSTVDWGEEDKHRREHPCAHRAKSACGFGFLERCHERAGRDEEEEPCRHREKGAERFLLEHEHDWR